MFALYSDSCSSFYLGNPVSFGPLNRSAVTWAMKMARHDNAALSLAVIPLKLVAQPAAYGRGSNWVHDSLEEREVPGCGFGAYARTDVAAGTLLVVYGGAVLTLQGFEALSSEMQNYPYQVEEDLFLGPASESDIGVGERLNHSCSPNAGFDGAIHIVALRDICAGEQVTIDYATCVSAEHEAFRMACVCGAPHCRGVVTGEDWKLPAVQRRLLAHFQPYLRRKVAALSAPVNRDKVRFAARAKQAVLWPLDFFRRAVSEEWLAAPVSCAAALPSNLATCFIMELLAPLLISFGIVREGAQSIALIAAVTPFVGYATYLLAYYAGMLVKERRDFFVNGRLRRRALRRKLTVVWLDFLAHLPSDLLVIPAMGAVQGSFAFAGMQQFWAIFWAQCIADFAYAWKEPFFWHAAKRLERWRFERR